MAGERSLFLVAGVAGNLGLALFSGIIPNQFPGASATALVLIALGACSLALFAAQADASESPE